ncbi:MAG: RsmB/NOP family class I SAM-dependent RNA methyltransferase [Acidiferrobacter sp.]
MTTNDLRHASIALLTRILTTRAAADTLMGAFFRQHRSLGTRDRGRIAEITYGCLRHYRLLTVMGGDTAPTVVVATYLAALRADGGPTDGDVEQLPRAATVTAHDPWPWAVTASVPDWLAATLTTALGPDEARALAMAWLQPAPLDIRVNPLRADRAAVAATLQAEGHSLQPTPYSPLGLRRRLRAPLFHTNAFHGGQFEVQDEGSQLIAPLLEPRRGERIVDFCAGAGGKTLHLGALMGNSGTLYAFDTARQRLERLKTRIVRAGLDNVRVQSISSGTDQKVKRLHGKIDRVLVDAPCSGTGTLRRSPDIKWRLTPERIDTLAANARAILAAAARLVRPGGRLVYATCSVLPAENEEVIRDFLVTHEDFTAVDTPAILARRGIVTGVPGGALRLWPHHHGTDGFFAQVLDRDGD